jgi:HAE1 family hydrophobic/amphiphilic exporter-1
LTGQIQAQNGTSSDQMYKYLDQVSRIINADPNVEGVFSQIQGGNGSAGSNGAFLNIIVLKPLKERKLSADQIIRELRPKLNHIPGINVFLTNPPSIRIGGRGSRSQYQYTMQSLDLKELQDISGRLMTQMRTMSAFVDVNSDLDDVMPAVQVKINRDRAAALGVSAQQIETALGEAFSGTQISQINTSANQYQVIVELLPKFQSSPAALQRLYITSTSGQLVPLSAVTTTVAGTQPLTVNHSGQVPAVTVSFDLPPGKTLSDAVTAMRQATQAVGVPDSVTSSFQGTAAAFQSSTQNMGMLLLIAIIVVYIILGILYESFIHPLTILSGLPSAALGALLTLFIVGLPLTLYAFVGMIMLIGIVKKNAIMMIDFALERQRSTNITPEQAIYEAALTRFRPIMMTTMAAMMGTMPIALGLGAGAESRRPLGLCVAGGLLLSQLLTLYITPVIYTYLDRLGTRFSVFGKKRGSSAPHAAPAE